LDICPGAPEFLVTPLIVGGMCGGLGACVIHDLLDSCVCSIHEQNEISPLISFFASRLPELSPREGL